MTVLKLFISLIIGLLLVAGVVIAVVLLSMKASAHDDYTGTKDPVTGKYCCSTSAGDNYGDCDILDVTATNLTAEADGYRVILTAEEAQRINPATVIPVNILIPWDRVQPSKDGNYRICFSRWGELYCFFAPPNT